MALQYKVIPVTDFGQNCSLLWCDQTRQAVLVDPGGETDRLLAEIEEKNLVLSALWLTHGHIDHVAGAPQLREKMSVKIYGPHQADQFWLERVPEQARRFSFLAGGEAFTPDTWLKEGDHLTVGNETLTVKHIPGHTPGHVVFCHAPSHLLVGGDVLFYRSVGRTDFEQGSQDDLLTNIREKLLILPDDTTVITGHGPLTTIGAEKQNNPYLKPR